MAGMLRALLSRSGLMKRERHLSSVVIISQSSMKESCIWHDITLTVDVAGFPILFSVQPIGDVSIVRIKLHLYCT